MAKVKHQTSFRIDQPADKLFPLFSAEGEKLWAHGWDYENIMGSTELHEDYVFLTAGHHGAAHHEAAKMIWLVKRYEPADYFIQYYRVQPGDKVGIVTVRCKPLTQGSTEVDVAYEYIGLSEKGNEFIKAYTVEAHEAFISPWPVSLEAYFEKKPD